MITCLNLPPIAEDGMLSILCCSPSIAALHRGTTMSCKTYPPIVNFLSPSVVHRPTSNARTIWQTVFDCHQLLLSIISANVLWSIKGVGVERRYEGSTTWPRKIVLPFFGWTAGNLGVKHDRCPSSVLPCCKELVRGVADPTTSR